MRALVHNSMASRGAEPKLTEELLNEAIINKQSTITETKSYVSESRSDFLRAVLKIIGFSIFRK